MPDSPLVIADTSIRVDAAGRFSLNDLHRAAGGQKRHGPSYWLATKQAEALIAELQTTGIPVDKSEGRAGGTFVCKELVYAYAMWISPAFHLKVIRAYDALVSRPPTQDPAVAQLANLILKGLEAQLQGRLLGVTAEPRQSSLPGLEPVAEVTRLHIDIPADLHRQMKVSAASSRSTLKTWVINACRNELSRGVA